MKIDSPSTTSHSKPVQREAATGTTLTKSVSSENRKNRVDSKSKINQWFAKLGIPSHFLLFDAKEKQQVVSTRARLKAERQVENLSAIFDLATEVTMLEGNDEQIDPDWFYAFTDLAENIHSPSMQELWSKILAVEISHPGSFSLNSLETLRRLTQRDAKLFSAACRLASRRHGDTVPRILTEFHQRKTLTRWFTSARSVPVNLATHGLSYPSLLALIDLGLIINNEIESAELPVNKPVSFKCGERTFQLRAKRNGVALAYYKFTGVGAELFKLTKRHENTAYLEELTKVLSPAFQIKM